MELEAPGSVGKITNCQIGVFAAYVSHKGHAFIGRALYLPKAWTADPVRMKAAHVPDTVAFATKPALASMMIGRAIAAGVPFAWVAADSVYGVGEVEKTLRRTALPWCRALQTGVAMLLRASSGRYPLLHLQSAALCSRRQTSDWHAPPARSRDRPYDWAYCPLADLDAEEFDAPSAGLWTRGLLIRRSVTDGECAYFTTWCPHGTSIGTLVRVEGTRAITPNKTKTRPGKNSSDGPSRKSGGLP